MIKYATVIDETTKLCNVGVGKNFAFYERIGMKPMDVEQAYDGQWYLTGFAPVQSIEQQNETIRATREQLYVQTSDKIKADYDEALARGSEEADTLRQEWLASKDKIREENPYVTEPTADKL